MNATVGESEIDPAAMRHLVANAAHDLKTPLASFMTGANLISMFSKDLEEKIHQSVFDDDVAANLLESVHNIKMNVQDIINMNTFMMMTINRFQDFSKASSGMKLVPKNETCELAETLRLPLVCMQNSQDSCPITMEPVPSEICDAVITDKLWLQENLLCLLSNAVKYSGGKAVSVAIHLREASPSSFSSPPIGTTYAFELLSSTQMSRNDSSVKQAFNFENVSSSAKVEASDKLPSFLQRPQFNKTRSNNNSTLARALVLGPSFDSDCATPSTRSPRVIEKVEMLCIEVTDSGIGVPAALKSQLFQPFQQTQRLAGGTGLGLYSLAKRCDALQGEYGVRDREDGQPGSVFYFAVPYRPDEIAAGMFAVAHEAAEDASHHHHHAIRNLVPHCPSAPPSKHHPARHHRRTTVSASSSPNDANKAAPFGLSPLVLSDPAEGNQEKSEMSVNPAATSTMVHSNRSPTPKESSFLLKKSFSVNESGNANGTDMIVKIISATSTTVAMIRTPRNVLMSPRNKTSVMSPPHHNIKDSTLFLPRDETTTTGTSLRLLLVEDCVSIAKMTSMLLKRQGYTVHLANNGTVALELVTQDPGAFDIILMDLQMPVMDGLEATRRIRLQELKQSSQLKFRQRIVGLSANNDVDTMSAAFESGFDAFMEKPIDMAIFQSTATELMQLVA